MLSECLSQRLHALRPFRRARARERSRLFVEDKRGLALRLRLQLARLLRHRSTDALARRSIARIRVDPTPELAKPGVEVAGAHDLEPLFEVVALRRTRL